MPNTDFLMTVPQQEYIEKLADKHGLSYADLDQICVELTGEEGTQWRRINKHLASQVIDHLLKEYGGFS